MNTLPLPARSKAAAPAQYYGFGLQTIRLCYHLLTCPETAGVTIEHSDDVAVHGPGKALLLEQAKSALSTNPVSNWAGDLWKTFANWLDEIDAGRVDPSVTKFRLYVTPKKSGLWVSQLSEAQSNDDIDAVIQTIRLAAKKRATEPACADSLKRVLAADPARLRALFRNFTFHSDELDPVEPIKELMRKFLPDPLVELSWKFALGHAKGETDRLIRANSPALIMAKDFLLQVKAFIQSNDLGRYLVSFVDTPAAELVALKLGERPPFVRQLELIEVDRESIVRAVSDFLQSSADKTEWADRGVVVRDSLRNYDDGLVRQFNAIKLELNATHSGLTAINCGQALYARCIQTKALLDGREVPLHFVPGCYNDLADRFKLGWHSDYASLLSSKAA